MEKRINPQQEFAEQLARIEGRNTRSFRDDFPQVESLDIAILEIIIGDLHDKSRTASYNYSRDEAPCSNRFCRQGGLEIRDLIRQMVWQKQTHQNVRRKCKGFEGSPKGRRKDGPCGRWFDVTVSIAYRTEADPSASA